MENEIKVGSIVTHRVQKLGPGAVVSVWKDPDFGVLVKVFWQISTEFKEHPLNRLKLEE